MTFASNPNTQARTLEHLGREAAEDIIRADGSMDSKVRFFRAGFNEVMISRQYPTLEFVTQKMRRQTLREKIMFKWNRFLFKRGWKK